MTLAEVRLWGRTIGAVSQESDASYATFQYDPDFARSGIEIAPLSMPLARHPYAFPQLARRSFRGLPGLLADSLPDYFGNALIDAWLARQGRSPDSFSLGIEVKASATVRREDFRGLKKLASAGGEDFRLGVILYDGDRVLPFGEGLFAAPISALWT